MNAREVTINKLRVLAAMANPLQKQVLEDAANQIESDDLSIQRLEVMLHQCCVIAASRLAAVAFLGTALLVFIAYRIFSS